MLSSPCSNLCSFPFAYSPLSQSTTNLPPSRMGSTRLYSKGRILGHKRAKRNSSPNQSLIAIDGVDTKEAARAYLGKVRRGV